MKSPITSQRIILITLATLLILYIFFSKRGIRHYFELQKTIVEDTQQVIELEQTIAELKEKIDVWQKENFEQELMARQDLNMGFTNELVYKVSQTKA